MFVNYARVFATEAEDGVSVQVGDRVRRATVRAVQTHCKRGHEFSPENTLVLKSGSRQCRACSRQRNADHVKGKMVEGGVEIACPACKKVRTVSSAYAARLRTAFHICASCSRKPIRKGMKFRPIECVKCKRTFERFSGKAKYCDECAKRDPIEPKPCAVCQKRFLGYASKKTCSPACARRLRLNETYFGGRLFETIGWETKTCQVCGLSREKNMHAHHVYGHPNHEALVLLCAGCHDVVSVLAMRKMPVVAMKRVMFYAVAQQLRRPLTDAELAIVGGSPRALRECQ